MGVAQTIAIALIAWLGLSFPLGVFVGRCLRKREG